MQSDLVAQINTDHLLQNYQALRACCRPGVKLCAPLKADAYGHGVAIVAPALQEAGADYAAVATVSEAIELRALGWQPPILILGNILAVSDRMERRDRIAAVVKHHLMVTIADTATVRHVIEAEPPEPISVHIKMDSGMGRMGVMPSGVAELVKLVRATRCLRPAGFYSHFATADFENGDLVGRQLRTFGQTASSMAADLPSDTLCHLANSAATITLPAAHFDMVRPGLALYGYPPAPRMSELIELKPILRLVSHVTAMKELPIGHCVGYGQTFTASRPTRLGIIPAGYFDGFPRSLSNAAIVGTPYGDAPIIGRVSMDQLAVDLTDLPAMAMGSEVTLIDDRPNRPNSVQSLARHLGTIPYEITCLLGQRVQRVRVGGGRDVRPGRSHP
jgi:alanine racemase